MSAISAGDRLILDVGQIAHGGHFIAHAEGMTIFVRGAITGERVVAEVTQVKRKIALAEVVEVITASEYRVEPPCHFFRENVCGGCDFQHIDLAYQRKLKSQVVMDSFRRIAGLEVSVECLPASVDESGFHWRTRMDFTVAPGGRAALHPYHSDSLTEIDSCLIAREEIDIKSINQVIEQSGNKVSPFSRIRVGTSFDGQLKVSGRDSSIEMRVGNKRYPISIDSFWQSHRSAAELLVARARDLLSVRTGDLVLDLYGGVGLFTAFLRDDVGEQGHVILIESDRSAIKDARKLFNKDERVTVMEGRVEERISTIDRCDLVLLDPPRSGMVPAVIAELGRLRPRQILYISCDPATLARDAKALLALGYEMATLEALDLFPMTEHIESVANFIHSSP